MNWIAFIASAFLAVDLISASGNGMERKGAAAFYLVWNFGSTVLWVSEVSVESVAWMKNNNSIWTTGYDESRSRLNVSTTALIGELLLAIWFTIDSIRLLFKWKLKKEDIDADMVEVILTTFAYAYMSIVTSREYYSKTNAQGLYTPVPDPETISAIV